MEAGVLLDPCRRRRLRSSWVWPAGGLCECCTVPVECTADLEPGTAASGNHLIGSLTRSRGLADSLKAAGLPQGFHFHDLRRTGNHLAAQSGANLKGGDAADGPCQRPRRDELPARHRRAAPGKPGRPVDANRPLIAQTVF